MLDILISNLQYTCVSETLILVRFILLTVGYDPGFMTNLYLVDKLHVPFVDHKVGDLPCPLAANSPHPACPMDVVWHKQREVKVHNMLYLKESA